MNGEGDRYGDDDDDGVVDDDDANDDDGFSQTQNKYELCN